MLKKAPAALAAAALSLTLTGLLGIAPIQAAAAEDTVQRPEVSAASQLRKQRIELRRKLLGTWILTALDDSLKKSMRFKGQRPAGSSYIQGLIKDYKDK